MIYAIVTKVLVNTTQQNNKNEPVYTYLETCEYYGGRMVAVNMIIIIIST